MNSTNLKIIAIPWGLAGIFLFLFYSTVYFPLEKSLQKSNRYIHKKQYDHAILEASRIIANFPNYSSTYFVRARAYTLRHDWDLAIADYTQIMKLNYDAPSAYLRQGDLYLLKGDYDQAIFDYSQLLQAHFYYKEPYLKRSMAYFGKKDYGKSLDDMRRAQSLDIKIPSSFLKKLENAIKTK